MPVCDDCKKALCRIAVGRVGCRAFLCLLCAQVYMQRYGLGTGNGVVTSWWASGLYL